jgi:adenine-specific DNA-methyltransferase
MKGEPYKWQQKREEICAMLNDVDWEDLGFMCGNRYVFSQKALSNTYLPSNFASGHH